MGVIGNLGKVVRHPGLFVKALRWSWRYSRNNNSGELQTLRNLIPHAKRVGVSPDFCLKARAREAELLLRCDEPQEARQLLLSVLKDCKDRSDDLGRHLSLFARYYISMIDIRPLQADYWAKRASELGLSKRGFTEIPAPYESKDEFDEEFERIEAEIQKELEAKL